MDGENYQKSFRSMKTKFELFQQNLNNVILKRSDKPIIYKPVYLHFGIFYDGAQLFDRSNLISNEYAAEEEFNDQEAPDEYESA